MEVNNFVWTENAIEDWIDIWAVLWSEVEIGDFPFKWVWNHGDKYVFGRPTLFTSLRTQRCTSMPRFHFQRFLRLEKSVI